MSTRTIYVTKYALTKGIIEARPGSEADLWVKGTYVYTVGKWAQQFKLGTDAFLTEDEARAAAEKARTNKLSSLAKQIERIRNLEIKVVQS